MTEPNGDGVGTTQTSGPVVITGLEGLEAHVGQKVGVSDWKTVVQEDINTFAKLTGDEQWIHVDPERAAKDPGRHDHPARLPHPRHVHRPALAVCVVEGFG